MMDRKHTKYEQTPLVLQHLAISIISLSRSGHYAFKFSVGLFGQDGTTVLPRECGDISGWGLLRVNGGWLLAWTDSRYSGDFSYDLTTIITVGNKSTNTQPADQPKIPGSLNILQ